MKPDIFNPYVELSKFHDAGIVKIFGRGIVYDISPGSPYECAYQDAFKLAVTAQLPLWLATTFMEYELLYHPKPMSLVQDAKSKD